MRQNADNYPSEMEKRDLSELVDRFRLRQRRLPPIYDQASTWYEPWYFELRLAEEAKRAVRHGLDMALVYVVLTEPEGALSPARQLLMNALAGVVATGLRETDIPGRVLPGHYAICLPHTAEDGADMVRERVVSLLDEFDARGGVAVLSDDCAESGELLSSALEAAINGSRGQPRAGAVSDDG